MGWLLDGIHKTIKLPKDKWDKIIKLLLELNRKTYVSINELQSIQGKLQFASIGIPLGKPLLGPIDRIIADAEKKGYYKVKINHIIICGKPTFYVFSQYGQNFELS